MALSQGAGDGRDFRSRDGLWSLTTAKMPNRIPFGRVASYLNPVREYEVTLEWEIENKIACLEVRIARSPACGCVVCDKKSSGLHSWDKQIFHRISPAAAEDHGCPCLCDLQQRFPDQFCYFPTGSADPSSPKKLRVVFRTPPLGLIKMDCV